MRRRFEKEEQTSRLRTLNTTTGLHLLGITDCHPFFILHEKHYPSLVTMLSQKNSCVGRDIETILFFIFKSGRGEN